MKPFLSFLLCLLPFLGGLAQDSRSLQVSQGQSRPLYEEGKIIFKLKPGLSLNYGNFDEVLRSIGITADQYQGSSLEFTFRLFAKSDPEFQRIYTLNFSDFSATETLLKKFQSDSRVEYAQRVSISYVSSPNDYFAGAQPYLTKINAPGAWTLGTGSMTIRVAVVDNGINIDHQDLNDNVWLNPLENTGSTGVDEDGNGFLDDERGWDFGDGDNNVRPTGSSCFSVPGFSHGSHVAGLAAAETNNGIGIAALSHNVSLIPVKCSRDGDGTCGGALYSTMQAVEYAVSMGAHVVNMSFGNNTYEYAWQDLINKAYNSNVVLVAAVGNDGKDIADNTYPAAYDHVIAVGATDANDDITWFSNYGTKVDVMAPGEAIYSCFSNSNTAYNFLDGTSMASPIVSSLCALMLSQNPNLTPDGIEACIKSTCQNIYPLNDPKYAGKLGAGRINAFAAMNCLNGPPTADFSSNFQTVCPSQPVTFAVRNLGTTGINSYAWSFPGGSPSSSTLANPVVLYGATGVYDVSVTVTNASGSTTIPVKTGYIKVVPNSSNFSNKVDNHWNMNGNNAVQFSTGEPLNEAANGHLPWETSASMSNADGQLLFYTDGVAVRNRHRTVMQNGTALSGHTSTTQGALIVPEPGVCKSKYYLFTLTTANSGCPPGWPPGYPSLVYSVIDMDMAGGLGAVTSKNVPVFGGANPPKLRETITATLHCNDTSVWVLVHEYGTNNFYTIPVTTSGVGAPIARPAGVGVSCTTNPGAIAGQMKFSPSGSKIAIVYPEATGVAKVELFDFNKSTGAVSLSAQQPVVPAGTGTEWYATEFSPSGNMVYFGNSDTSIYQYDLVANITSKIRLVQNSATQVGSFELGPNGQIYFANLPFGYPGNLISGATADIYRSYLGAITNPDAAGYACDINHQAMKMAKYSVVNRVCGLANGFISKTLNYQQSLIGLPDLVIKCTGDDTTITAHVKAPPGVTPTFQWYAQSSGLLSGQTDSVLIALNEDVYRLEVTISGCKYQAFVKVVNEKVKVTLGADIPDFKCGDVLLLNAGKGYKSYLWSTGDTSQTITVFETGTYYVSVYNNAGCFATDTIVLSGEPCCLADPLYHSFQQIYNHSFTDAEPVALITDTVYQRNWVLERKSADKAYLSRVSDVGKIQESRIITPTAVSGKNWVLKDMAQNQNSDIPLILGDNGKDIYLGQFFTDNFYNYYEKSVKATGAQSTHQLSLASAQPWFNTSNVQDGHLILGQRQYGSPVLKDIILFRVDMYGDVVSTMQKAFSGNGTGSVYQETPYEVIQYKNAAQQYDGYLILARQDYIEQGDTFSKGLLVKTNAAGTPQKTLRFPYFYYSATQSFDAAGNPTGYILVGSAYHQDSLNRSAKNAQLMITRLDTSLNHRWTKTLQPFDYSEVAYDSSYWWYYQNNYQFTMGGTGVVQSTLNRQDFFVSGISFDQKFQRYEYYILKIDSTGKLDGFSLVDRNHNDSTDHNFEWDPKHLLQPSREGGAILLGKEEKFSLTKTTPDVFSKCAYDARFRLSDTTNSPVQVMMVNPVLTLGNDEYYASQVDSLQISSSCCTVRSSIADPCKMLGKIGFKVSIAEDGTIAHFQLDSATQVLWDAGEITELEWNFADGTLEFDKDSFSHEYSYTVPTTYNVFLRAKFRSGCNRLTQDFVTTSCNWNDPSSVLYPARQLDYDSVILGPATRKYVLDGPLPAGFTVSWDFGDGTQDTGVNVTHEYEYSGDYLVCMTLKHKDGCERKLCRWQRICLESKVIEVCGSEFFPLPIKLPSFQGAQSYLVQQMPFGSPEWFVVQDTGNVVNFQPGVTKVTYRGAHETIICVTEYTISPSAPTWDGWDTTINLSFCPINGSTGKWVSVCNYIADTPDRYMFTLTKLSPLPAPPPFNSDQWRKDQGMEPCISFHLQPGLHEVRVHDKDSCTYRSYFFNITEELPVGAVCDRVVDVPCEQVYYSPDAFPPDTTLCPNCRYTGNNVQEDGFWVYDAPTETYSKNYYDYDNCRVCTYNLRIRRVFEEPTLLLGIQAGGCAEIDLAMHFPCFGARTPGTYASYFAPGAPPVSVPGNIATICCGMPGWHRFEVTMPNGCICKMNVYVICLPPMIAPIKGVLPADQAERDELLAQLQLAIEKGTSPVMYPVNTTDEAQLALMLIPNPTADAFRILPTNNIALYERVEILDMLGRKIMVKEQVPSDYTFSMAEQAQGAYMVRVTIGDQVTVLRLTVQH